MSSTITAPRRHHPQEDRGRWWRFAFLVVITLVVTAPIAVVLYLATQPGPNSTATGFTLENFTRLFTSSDVLTWLRNSLVLALVTVVASVAVAAPAGYVLSRVRNRFVSGFSLILFVVQALPVITAAIPLFLTFTVLGLVDTTAGVAIIYIGSTLSVAIWMMAAYIDSIPIALEEAAWIDGASVLGGFLRVVLRNSLPGLLSTAIFAFLLAWNDYLIALLFLASPEKLTLPIGLESFFQQTAVDWPAIMALSVVIMAPPVLIFAVLTRYFSVGGISGSLGGR